MGTNWTVADSENWRWTWPQWRNFWAWFTNMYKQCLYSLPQVDSGMLCGCDQIIQMWVCPYFQVPNFKLQLDQRMPTYRNYLPHTLGSSSEWTPSWKWTSVFETHSRFWNYPHFIPEIPNTQNEINGRSPLVVTNPYIKDGVNIGWTWVNWGFPTLKFLAVWGSRYLNLTNILKIPRELSPIKSSHKNIIPLSSPYHPLIIPITGGFNLRKMMEWKSVGIMTFPIWWERRRVNALRQSAIVSIRQI